MTNGYNGRGAGRSPLSRGITAPSGNETCWPSHFHARGIGSDDDVLADTPREVSFVNWDLQARFGNLIIARLVGVCWLSRGLTMLQKCCSTKLAYFSGELSITAAEVCTVIFFSLVTMMFSANYFGMKQALKWVSFIRVNACREKCP